MKTLLSVLIVATALVGLTLTAPISAQDEEKNNEQDGVETMARGPVHEGFAEATDSTATPGIVVTKLPPDPITELPPEEKPEGETVAWLPGYWGWDEEANDFLWISGAWRPCPVGRTWVPGSWQQVSTGHQWVSGYWGEIEKQAPEANKSNETEYLPKPPESHERGPSSPAPAEDYTYVPGTHVHNVSRYVWRPGYWVKYRPGWVWIPACYKWTPCGYIFVSGFWDAPLCERGFLFAPVVIRRNVYLRRGFVYRPAHVIQPDFFLGSLFVRARTRTYHFGNYFEAKHRRNYVSWVDYRIHKVSYDPNYAYYRAAYVKYPTWDRNLRTLYKARYNGDIARPPVSLSQQRTVVRTIVTQKTSGTVVHRNVAITNVQNVTVLAPVRKQATVRMTGLATLAGFKPSEVAKAPVTRVVKVETVTKARLQAENRQIERLRVVGQQRKASEVRAVTNLPTSGTLEKPMQVKVDLPRGTPAARVLETTIKPPPLPEKSMTATTVNKDKVGSDPSSRDNGTSSKLPSSKLIDPVPLGKRIDPVPLGKRIDPVPLGKRIDPVPLGKRIDPVPVLKRTDPVPLGKRIDRVPLGKRIDPVPVPKRIDPVPKRIDPVPKRIDPVPKRIDRVPLTKRIDPVPVPKRLAPPPLLKRFDPPAVSRINPVPLTKRFDPPPVRRINPAPLVNRSSPPPVNRSNPVPLRSGRR